MNLSHRLETTSTEKAFDFEKNDNKFTLDFDSPVLPSIETNVNNGLGELSDELLVNSTLLNNSYSSLNELYDDPIEYGDPITDAYYWRQQDGSTSCAVVAQISIYESLTGERITESSASEVAHQQGWFDPVTGTPEEYVGYILEDLNIDTFQMNDATLETLQYALSIGDKPIVGLDANEIWNPQYDLYGNPIEQEDAGHAVWVTGIDYQTDGSVDIILNDSGHPNGSASMVDYYDFMNAWQDYDHFVTIADNPFT